MTSLHASSFEPTNQPPDCTQYLVAQEAGKPGKGAVAAAAEVEDEIDDNALRRRLERVEERVDLDRARLGVRVEDTEKYKRKNMKKNRSARF